MSRLKLSICIATLNRASFIGATLDSLLPQDEDEVEIVVLDGASSDDTEEILSGYAVTHECIRYIRMEKNSGVDRDYDLAVQHARGEYCWLMTDDDIVKPGAVRVVLDALETPYSLVIVNAEVRNADLTVLLDSGRLDFRTPRTYQPNERDRLFAETARYLTFIGGVVIRRSIWLQRQREEYYGSLFIHVGVIFQDSLPEPSLAIADPLIVIRYGNAMWRPRDFEIWMFKWPSLVWSLPGLSDSARRSVCPSEPWREFARLMFYRAKGAYSLQEYRRWIGPRCSQMPTRLLAFALALLPGQLANVVALVYFRVFDRDQGIGLSEVQSSRFHFRHWFSSQRTS